MLQKYFYRPQSASADTRCPTGTLGQNLIAGALSGALRRPSIFAFAQILLDKHVICGYNGNGVQPVRQKVFLLLFDKYFLTSTDSLVIMGMTSYFASKSAKQRAPARNVRGHFGVILSRAKTRQQGRHVRRRV